MFISRRHSSIDRTNCFSATIASFEKFGLELRPKPATKMKKKKNINFDIECEQNWVQTNPICRWRRLVCVVPADLNSMPRTRHQLPCHAAALMVSLTSVYLMKLSILYLLRLLSVQYPRNSLYTVTSKLLNGNEKKNIIEYLFCGSWRGWRYSLTWQKFLFSSTKHPFWCCYRWPIQPAQESAENVNNMKR